MAFKLPKLWLAFAVFCLLTGLGCSLECLKCVNSWSWADCVSAGQKRQCPEGCAKLKLGDIFFANCASPELCEDFCEDQTDCEVECCSEDMCNGGSELKPEPEGNLTCLMCRSYFSMDDCTKYQTEHKCRPWDRCSTISYRVHGIKVFQKSCINKESCQAGCSEIEGDCESVCCDTNNCNV